jgi:hypothetical protein
MAAVYFNGCSCETETSTRSFYANTTCCEATTAERNRADTADERTEPNCWTFLHEENKVKSVCVDKMKSLQKDKQSCSLDCCSQNVFCKDGFSRTRHSNNTPTQERENTTREIRTSKEKTANRKTHDTKPTEISHSVLHFVLLSSSLSPTHVRNSRFLVYLTFSLLLVQHLCVCTTLAASFAELGSLIETPADTSGVPGSSLPYSSARHPSPGGVSLGAGWLEDSSALNIPPASSSSVVHRGNGYALV